MSPGTLLDDLTPLGRVAVAVFPFTITLLIRLLMGRSQLTRWMVTVSTMWFAINVLLAPYSNSMRQDLMSLRTLFR